MRRRQLLQGRIGESNASIDRLDAARGEAIMNSNHQGTRVRLTLDSRGHRTSKGCIDRWLRVCQHD